MAKSGRNVQSVERAVGILQALSRHPRGLGLGELAEEMGLPAQTAQSLVRTLEALGMVTQARPRTPYCLGPEAVAMVRRWLGADGQVEAARPIVEELGRATGEHTVLVSLRAGAFYRLVETPSTHVIGVSPRYGDAPVNPTMATTKVLLAWADPGTREAVLRGFDFNPQGPPAIRDAERYRRYLREVRRQGHAVSVNETSSELTALAVPVGEPGVCAALGCALPTARCEAGRRAELLDMLRASAHRIALAWGLPA